MPSLIRCDWNAKAGAESVGWKPWKTSLGKIRIEWFKMMIRLLYPYCLTIIRGSIIRRLLEHRKKILRKFPNVFSHTLRLGR